jgi:hypothetical protein
MVNSKLLNIESKMLATGIETRAETAIPCKEIQFQVDSLKHTLFDENRFDSEGIFAPYDFHDVEFNVSGTHITYHQLSKEEGAQDGEKILVASLFPASAEKIIMYCYAQKDGQDHVVPITVFDRERKIWIKDVCADRFAAGSAENKLSTLIFRITGQDGNFTDILSRTVLTEGDEYDDMDESGNPVGEKLSIIKSLVAQGIVDVIAPKALAS